MPSSKKNKTPKQPQDRKKPTTGYGSSWKKPLTDLPLPSGEMCQVKRPGVQGLIKAGVLHSLDSLTGIVQNETIPKAQGKPVTDVKAIADDPETFGRMMEQVDKIVVHVVQQPKVVSNMVPVLDENDQPVKDEENKTVLRELTDEEKDERAAEWDASHPELPLVFVDWIDAIDKMFIMNFAVGGSADLAEFRSATQASLGGLSAGEAAESPTE